MGIVGETYRADWAEAPSWAKWIAQDADGSWSWFSTKPQAKPWGLYADGTYVASGKGKKETIKTGDGNYYLTRPNADWKATIEKRPSHLNQLSNKGQL